jgi:hypothetical protein
MLFNYSTTFEETLDVWVESEYEIFYIVVFIEHIVIFILIAIKYLIPDVPSAIKKSNERTKNEIKTLHKVDLTDSTRVKELEDELELLQQKMKKMEDKKPGNNALEIIRYH